MTRSWFIAAGVVAASLMGGAALRSAQDRPKKPRELAEARRAIAERQYENARRMIFEPQNRAQRDDAGATIEDLCLWSRRWMEAQRDAAEADDDRRAALRDHVDRLARWVGPLMDLARRRQVGVSQADLDALEFHRLEAEYGLALEEAKR